MMKVLSSRDDRAIPHDTVLGVFSVVSTPILVPVVQKMRNDSVESLLAATDWLHLKYLLLKIVVMVCLQ